MAADLLTQAEPVPKVALTVRVTAERNGSNYRYEAADPSGTPESCDAADALVLPANRRVRLLATSSDAIHTWRVLDLGIAVDLIPGRINEVLTGRLPTGQTVLRGRLEGAKGTSTEVAVRLVGDGRAAPALRSLCGD